MKSIKGLIAALFVIGTLTTSASAQDTAKDKQVFVTFEFIYSHVRWVTKIENYSSLNYGEELVCQFHHNSNTYAVNVVKSSYIPKERKVLDRSIFITGGDKNEIYLSVRNLSSFYVTFSSPEPYNVLIETDPGIYAPRYRRAEFFPCQIKDN